MSTPRPRGRPKRASTNINDDSMTQTIPTTLDAQPTTPRYTTLTPSALLRSASRRTPRGAPLTPFALRAIQRRTANTPGRDRRRSTRGPQRETAFDILRNLGRTLAPISKPIQSSPQDERSPTPESSSEIEDETIYLDQEPLPERPRLSLPLRADSGSSSDGSPDMPPPRLSLQFVEDDITQRSVEYPRRAISDKDRQRLERMSFGDVRMSENFGDLTRLDAFSEAGDITTLAQNDDDDIEQSQLDEGAFDAGGETADLGRFNLEFNFPSPAAPAAELDDPLPNDEDDFMLQTDQAEIPYPSSDDDDAAADGFTGFEVNIPDQVSDAGTTGTTGAGAGVVGGGLRDEPSMRTRKQKKLSRHGIPVPLLPTGVVKRLAARFARTGAGTKAKINKETLAAIEQASEWFFEQASEDLAAYSKHAGRKTIDESDVVALMRRQRLVNSTNTIFSLAQRHLPKELLQDIRLSLPP
ncbi:conserved hypothetical protein [Talaromyces stipitatus ATCC 10500]|uniref:CENP-T/Histone H4 histone fold domain-containing protein n=1 Tax=Talaromyces stipitatus (strain ATCC 10500 / CBS 375.48 / QM 6759 / NRRL 1006) TaxID=441959 RepID=B8MMW5_TALSN|nr:uncharacterized protein TSTA_101540 [Talaromyces stipitatus ATCC 10500]EED13914.1 conserved hypothetical protein [Talaromyces stipitatus ATCC 10500]